MEKSMTRKLLEKYLNDQCTRQEMDEVVHWLSSESLKSRTKFLISEDWGEMKEGDEVPVDQEFNSLLDKIHHKINLKSNASGGNGPLRNITQWLIRTAALFSLPLSAFFLHAQFTRQAVKQELTAFKVDSLEIIAPVGSRTVVHLSDGSRVYLNHGSRLKYPQVFDTQARGVVLEGEGYFDIAHDPDKPFIVRAGEVEVAATGTEFNVMAYPGEKVIETTLVKGKILFGRASSGINLGKLIPVEPGEHIKYDIDARKAFSTRGNTDKYIAWKDGRLIFKNESVVQITQRLSRWYNVDFIFKDNEVKKFSYTATFNDETLSQILELMETATPIRYTILPRKKISGQAFSKQVIILENRN